MKKDEIEKFHEALDKLELGIKVAFDLEDPDRWDKIDYQAAFQFTLATLRRWLDDARSAAPKRKSAKRYLI